jgi:helicase
MFRGLHIGIDRYTDPRVPWLSSAVRDARAPCVVRRHTRRAVRLADRRRRERCSDSGCVDDAGHHRGRCDVVVITYAGYGSEDHFLIPNDCDVSRVADTCISLDELADLISAIAGETLLCALDRCFSGGLGASVFSSGLTARAAAVRLIWVCPYSDAGGESSTPADLARALRALAFNRVQIGNA